MAAGMGSRYGGLKQLDAVGPHGEIIMEYSIFDALQTGFDKLVFVIRKNVERDFREALGARFAERAEIRYVFQELNHLPKSFAPPPHRRKPWGTGHALWTAQSVIDESFAVINADDFYGRDAFQTLSAFLRSQRQDQRSSSIACHYAMVAFTLQNTLSRFGGVARGICRSDPDGTLRHITEHTRIQRQGNEFTALDAQGRRQTLGGDEAVSMNMWGFTPSIFQHLEKDLTHFLEEHGQDINAEFYIPTVVDRLTQTRAAEVRLLRSTSPWFGITYQDDKAYVTDSIRRLIDQGVYPEKLWG